ncbi:MAG TPA: tetratricopeptide repeat protein [Polyangiaceae bacterium]|jgi:tetratricopeptide (TPR) repeat protein
MSAPLIRDLEKILVGLPDNVAVLRALAAMHEKQNDATKARELLARAIAIDPRCPLALAEMANLELCEAQDAKALALADQIEESLEADAELPRDDVAYALAIRGICLVREKKYEQAWPLLQEAKERSFLVSVTFKSFREACDAAKAKQKKKRPAVR